MCLSLKMTQWTGRTKSTVIQCKHRWETLRNRYSKSSKLLQLAASETFIDESPATCSFPYNEEMEFMLEHIKRRRPRKRSCYPLGSHGYPKMSSQAESTSTCDSEPAEVSRRDESLDHVPYICIPSPSSGGDTRVELERRPDSSQDDAREVRSEICHQLPKKKVREEPPNSPSGLVATEMQQNQVVTSESQQDEPVDGFLSYIRSELIRRTENERNVILAEFMNALARNPSNR
ncbi:hypothetical protein QYM36_015358 [Artemia franciscana]|uniref:MADF domain-containing protein n=1 Tax=Artemia franciscana TaxID=6661 RepID=A0AA88H8Z8_ARTSF|nr:hypothetical protein QYM36_015358 [Artemia franciscana]